MHRPAIVAAVGLIAAATLAYEILLVRVFAIATFHHFATMAIGVAMLGFGTSGTLLVLAGEIPPARAERWFRAAALLTPLALLASPALALRLRLDPTQLAWNLAEWPRLAMLETVLAAPFALGALSILLALTLEHERRGLLYGASFLGSGLGAVLAIAVLWVRTPVQALAVPAALASLAALAVPKRGLRSFGPPVVVLALALGAMVKPPWSIAISPYKSLPQIEAYPDAILKAERSSPRGWVAAVEAPAFRYAPGLSLGFEGRLPRQTALCVDGELAGAATRWDQEPGATLMLDWLPTALPYSLGGREHVLVLGAGGGTEVANAIVHGARRIVAVELQSDLVRLAASLGNLPPGRPGIAVDWHTGDGRSFMAGTPERFDLIVLGGEGGQGLGAAGVHALGEDFLHTVEAYESAIHRLAPGGVFAVTSWLTAPPRAGIRQTLTAVEALRRASRKTAPRARPSPEPVVLARRLLVAHSWGTAVVLLKPDGFGQGEIARVRRWAGTRGFDVDWYPGIEAPAAGLNQIGEPAFFRAAEAALAGPGQAVRFAREYPFEVSAVDDARPYPHHFMRPGSLGTFLGQGRGSFLPFAEWGVVAAAATLIQGTVLAGLLMLLPVMVVTARRRRVSRSASATAGTRSASRSRAVRAVLYFGMIGLGYMMAEIAAIQQLGLLLGHPIYAVAVVLATMLIGSGIGSIWSDRWPTSRVTFVAAGLALALLVLAAVLLGLVHAFEPSSLPTRALAVLAVLLPLSFLMGIPFPIGLRALEETKGPQDRTEGMRENDPNVERQRDGRRNDGLLAWAWAANGFASVTAAPLAALVALELGSRTLFGLSAGCYAAAALLGATAVAKELRPSRR